MAVPQLPNWQQVFLRSVGAPVTPANLKFIDAWAHAEGGSASNNPFNTTQGAPGATDYNSVHVRNYLTPQQGLQATAQTLQNGRYGNILSALKTGTDPLAAAQALANSPWGTGALVQKILGGGGGAAPSPAPAPPGVTAQQTQAPSLDLFNVGNQMFGLPQLMTPLPSRFLQAASAPAVSTKRVKFSQDYAVGDPAAAMTSVGGEHETMGLAGFPAHDYFAPSGSAAVAPVAGTIIKLSGHDPRQGPVDGPHGPLGWSVYIQGSDGHTYFLTHLGSRNVKVGQKVKVGQPIGTVADYAKYGTPSHIHMGVQ